MTSYRRGLVRISSPYLLTFNTNYHSLRYTLRPSRLCVKSLRSILPKWTGPPRPDRICLRSYSRRQ